MARITRILPSDASRIATAYHYLVLCALRISAAAGTLGSGTLSPPIACACPATYDAVCGSDFRTYRNGCIAACSLGEQGAWTSGSCTYTNPFDQSNNNSSMVACPTDPCNASSKNCTASRLGVACEAVRYTMSTLPNGTTLSPCSSLWYTANGSFAVCPPSVDKADCNCSVPRAPVCTTTNRNLDNACTALCQGYKIQYTGECRGGAISGNGGGSGGGGVGSSGGKDCDCIAQVRQVCGQDGRMYPNPCEAECQGSAVAFEGACGGDVTTSPPSSPAPPEAPKAPEPPRTPQPPRSPDPPQLPAQLRPLVPPTTPPPSCSSCPLAYVPVCGIDGQTYPNRCVLDCMGKALRKTGKCQHCNNDECLWGKKNDLCTLGSSRQCWSAKYECRLPPDGKEGDFLGKCLPKNVAFSSASPRRRRSLGSQDGMQD